jgi:hypothetical protein
MFILQRQDTITNRLLTMNIFTRIIVILAIGSAMAQAEEYHTLYAMTSEASVDVLPTDLVEVVYGGVTNGYNLEYRVQLENDSFLQAIFDPASPPKFTGIKNFKVLTQNNGRNVVTLRITHTEELSKVGPTSVLVIPENSTGNYDVVVESSGDMTTWSPFVSQTVQSDAAKNFFRVRIVKK